MRSLRRTRKFPALLVLALLLAVFAVGSRPTGAASGDDEKYRVFCVNGKVDFGNRTLQEMRWDFGKNVCLLHEYGTYREAKEDVRRRGGVGAECKTQDCAPGSED